MTCSAPRRSPGRYYVKTKSGERDEYAQHLSELHPEAAHAFSERCKLFAEGAKQHAYWNGGQALDAEAIAVFAALTRPCKLH